MNKLLGHAHLVESIGVLLRKDVQVGVFGEIGGQADDAVVCLSDFRERIAERASGAVR